MDFADAQLEVERIAALHGWEPDGHWHSASTGSSYLTLCKAPDFERSLTVRLSNHRQVYTGSVSLEFDSGDGVDFAPLERALTA